MLNLWQSVQKGLEARRAMTGKRSVLFAYMSIHWPKRNAAYEPFLSRLPKTSSI